MSTIPNEFDRLLTLEERALMKVRSSAYAAIHAGADNARIEAECQFGIRIALKELAKNEGAI